MLAVRGIFYIMANLQGIFLGTGAGVSIQHFFICVLFIRFVLNCSLSFMCSLRLQFIYTLTSVLSRVHRITDALSVSNLHVCIVCY